MTDSDLMPQLNEIYSAPEEPGMSKALTLIMDGHLTLSAAGQLMLSDSESYELKPMADLYIPTKSKGQEERVMALCMALEYAIAFRDHHSGHQMQDPEVIGILDKLGFKPESPLENLGAEIQSWLRLELSLGEYSRNDLRQAIRRCGRSAKRHHDIDGERGYLGFIHHLLH